MSYKSLIAVPVIIIAIIIQTTIASHIKLVQGTADVVLVMLAAWGLQDVRDGFLWAVLAGLAVSLISAMPIPVFLISYLICMAIARWFQHRMWQSPWLMMLVVTFLGSWVMMILSFLVLAVSGTSINWTQSLKDIMVPSVLLNLLISFPIHAIMGDLARWLFPEEGKI